jgi:signal transduction histidine kinase
VVVTNGRGEIVLANPAALEISQLPHAQLVGRSALDPAWDAIHDDGTPFPANEQPVAKAIATRQAVRNVVIGVRAHLADRLWLLSSAEPQLGPEGEVRQVVVSFMNITERRGIQARLALADRMVSVGTLAAGVAHEINNPLAYVIANLGYIAHDLERRGTRLVGAGPLVAAVNEAREGAERVRSIVRDLRTFSRGDEDRRGPVDVKRVVDSAISLVWNQIRHAARLTLDIGALPLVHANESRLAQVFVSLLVNAAQAMDGGDSAANQIRVVGKSDAAGRVVLEVADTGVGISPEDLKRVFDPFFTTKPLGMAAGLGLSICQGIIGELGGEITVESEPGKGSTFRVILPPLEAVRIAAERPPTEAGTSGRGRVLVIDDEAAIGSAIQRMLEDEHDVVFATGGAQALELLAHDAQFDAVLCDLLMPHMPGMEFFARLREAHPRLAEKTVFLTGGAFTPAAREFLDRTPNRVVEKPFDFDRLRALVAVVVKGE